MAHIKSFEVIKCNRNFLGVTTYLFAAFGMNNTILISIRNFLLMIILIVVKLR